MADRIPPHSEEIPHPDVPKIEPGELGEAKRKWADEGCQVPDEAEESLRRFEARAHEYTAEEMAEIQYRTTAALERQKISEATAARIFRVIDRVLQRESRSA